MDNQWSNNIDGVSSEYGQSLNASNHIHIQEESMTSNVYQSPNGTTYWIPNVEPEYKPVPGTFYDKWEDVVTMYEAYAEKAGFETRLGTTKYNKEGILTHRYILCNKAGQPTGQNFDSLDGCTKSPIRRSNFKVTNCKARIKLSVEKGGTRFELYGFIENHNHGFVSSYNLDLTKKRKKLNFSEMEYIAKCRLANVGLTKAFRLQAVLKGGHHMVRGTKTGFKNWARDIDQAIGLKDAEMVVANMKERARNLENFTFLHQVVCGELVAMFWADGVSKCHYDAFGDVLAFDATYQTNKYNMIFVPFTGVDHHKKCVTFGAGILYNETIESHEWLLKAFLQAHAKQPRLVLTDQDPAMKQAVSRVLDKAIHRLCMWHIMKKLPLKISGDLLNNTDLRRSIHKLVWNVYIKPSTFESRWMTLINEHGLTKHDWLNDMFNIRDQWVPGYFRDIPMCCLMKTTSRCESSNSLFKVNSSFTNTLVQFMMCFETALDGQRYVQRELQFQTIDTTPTFKAKLPIEQHAAHIYTRTVFLEVQKEILKGKHLCYIVNREAATGGFIYTVVHQDHMSTIVNEYTVTFDITSKSATCSCRGFIRIGYLCRHVFCVFRHHQVDKIPQQYIHSRWLTNALPPSVFSITNRYAAHQTRNDTIRHRIIDNIQQCADRVRGNDDRLAMLDEQVLQIKNQIFEEFPNEPNFNKKAAVIQDLIGPSASIVGSFTAPQGIRNKGSGTNKRLIGPGEKAIANSKKTPRKCGICKQYVTDHDKRNCPTKKKAPVSDPATPIAQEKPAQVED